MGSGAICSPFVLGGIMTRNTHSIPLYYSWLEIVRSDTFDICNRIRELDDGYFVVRNNKTNKFEVHNSNTHGTANEVFPSTFELVIPYDSLDSRTIDYCRRTSRQYQARLFEEMERNNRKIEESKQRKFKNDAEARAIELARDLRRSI